MDRRSFDQSLLIAIVSGGLVISLYSIFQLLFRLGTSAEISFNNFQNEINAAFVPGIIIVLIGFIFGMFTLRRKHSSIDQIWESNRKSVVNYYLNLVDVDVEVFDFIFRKLESEGFDFDKKSNSLTLGMIKEIDFNKIKKDFDELPLLKNSLGFITYEQHMAIYEYLKASNLFVDLLDKQNYQKEFLESRVEKAQKILNLFPGEESNHNGLKIWKEYFNQH